jgi:hypothetical protein
VVISAYALVGASVGLDQNVVAERLRGRIPARLIGGMLVLMGAGFPVRNTIVILATVDEPSRVDLGVCFVPFGLCVRAVAATPSRERD